MKNTVLTSRYKQDILGLLEVAKRVHGEQTGGEPYADSTASVACFKYGSFASDLRKWEGGQGGPTLKNCQRFEEFLRAKVGEEEYKAFLDRNNKPSGPVDLDDFGE